MFDNTQLGPEILSNPSKTQSLIIQEFQDRLGGKISIADPNNAFCFVLEANSSILAQTVRLAEKQFEILYPVRATTEEELYPHMSDFDYLNLSSTPAPVVFRLILDRDWLSANAAAYDTSYNKVIIPSTSIITLGGLGFSLYYPIEILINRTTNSILAMWDLSAPNPLFVQGSNFLNDVTEYTIAGLNLIALTFTAYQFTAAITREIATPGIGFNKSYTYTDRFYAARIYSQINGVYKELAYTLSQTIYDPTTPTAVLTVLGDQQTLQVNIPQVYFTQGQIGQNLRVEIYTTHGALNIAIAQADAQSVTANFDTASSLYAAILAQPPTLLLAPYEQTQITGGGNGMSFTQLRQAVINSSLYSQVPITPLELESAARVRGFSLTKYLDNITDRIYFASSPLTDPKTQILPPLGMLSTLIDLTASVNTNTMLTYGDNSTTILPTTLFRFNPTSNLCVPLTNAEVTYITSQSASGLTTALNSATYTRQPYHVVLYSSATYPVAKTLDLTGPEATALTFVAENPISPVQLTVASVNVTHLQFGTGGYQIGIGVRRSTSLKDANPATFYVVLSVRDRQDASLQLRAVYQSTTPLFDIYTLDIPTDYHFSQDLYMRTTLNTTAGLATLCEIPLQSRFNFFLGVSAAAHPTVSPSAALQPLVPNAYPDMLAVSQQSALVAFGLDLSSTVYNVVTSTWGAQAYTTYPTTLYYTYQHDVYATNLDGTLVTTINTSAGGVKSVALTKLHSLGDVVLDGLGNPAVQHAAGSLRLDASGNPIPLANRVVVHTVQMIQLDAALYASNTATDVDYVAGFSALLKTAITNLTPLKNNLLERTALYYKPARTLGLGTYGVGNGKTVQMSLRLSFSFVFYVPDAVLIDLVQQASIRKTTLQIVSHAVSQSIISLTDIAATLKATFGIKVTAIDIEGIDGNVSLQTLALIDNDAISAVALNLVVDDDGKLSLKPAINISFLLSANTP